MARNKAINEVGLDDLSFDLTAHPKKRANSIWRRLLTRRFLVISVAVHLLLGAIATTYVVQTVSTKRKLTFTAAPPSPNHSTRAIEHKVSMAKKLTTMSAPAAAKRITVSGAAKVSLPEMPSMPTSAAAPAKMAGAGGKGFGSGDTAGTMAAAGATGGSPINFFGMRTNASRVAFLLDYSGSMSGDFRTQMEQELEKSLKGLPSGTKVLVIPWAGGAWLYNQVATDIDDKWEKKGGFDNFELKPGQTLPPPEWVSINGERVSRIMAGVQAQKAWPGGTAWRPAFNYAMQAKPPPDTIFFLTDCQIPSKNVPDTVKDVQQMLQKAQPAPKVFSLWISNKHNSPEPMKQLATETGGQFRAVGESVDANPPDNKKK